MEIFRLSSVFKVSRMFGLFPFDDTVQCSKKWLTYCIFFQLLNCLILISFLLQCDDMLGNNPSKAASALAVLNCLVIISYLFSNIFTVINLIRNRAMVFHLLDSISKEIVKCYNFPKTRFYTIYVISFLTILLLLLWEMFFHNKFNLDTTYTTLVSFLISTSTVSFISQLWDLMRLLIVLLQETSKGNDENSIIALERISTYGESIKEIYGPFLFLLAALPFVELVCYLYMILLPAFPGMFGINFMLFLFTLSCFIKLGTIVYSCSNFLDEIQWFNDKLHWKILNDKTGRYSNNEMFFFHFIAYKKTKFSACGFFDIDYTLIGTMISVCTTYLVIVLQYGQGSQS
ncbi:Gustatory receptor 104a [Halyomorpha halys]|nr:Gustatory receptor 104a [Halyomorpha halys]